jgi:hypothetical protein
VPRHDDPWGGQATFRREVLECGFALVSEPNVAGLEENYVMVFKPVALDLATPGVGWSSPHHPR